MTEIKFGLPALKIPENCPNCKLPTKENTPFFERCHYDLRHHSLEQKEMYLPLILNDKLLLIVFINQ